MRACLDPPNMRIVHAIPFGKGFTRLIAGADCGNIIVGQPAVPMAQAIVMPSFFSRISVVFGFGANPQMSRVNARWVVTGMHNDFVTRNWPNVKLIRIPMSANRLFSRHQKNAVTVSVMRSVPFPATFCFLKTAFKHVLRAKHRILMQSCKFFSAVVTTAAQFTGYRFTGPTLNARKLGFGLISHRSPPVICSL